ncbi:MAG TPA: hypothetical protein PKW08_13235 [Flavobacteriaceae bacterium]|nr:hypothetical protein [Flavobacteriaceae bacterium]MCB9213270.1 hypothetical protein [Alteromonas sp.]HPF12378.1 hypothetical protein [Flavobacteriaceae bacterium]HQU22545.1 hypothetical protein [Flavobacteriaceae bacterium]HQU66246.1 hypothetical protein [Flavobacteriaceae bacterium]
MTRFELIKSLLYGILGMVFTIGGFIGLVFPQYAVSGSSSALKALIHATMELGAAVTPIGLLLLWSAFHPKEGRKLQYVYLLFFLLFAGVHWYEFLVGNRTIGSPLVNSVPFLLAIAVSILDSIMTR